MRCELFNRESYRNGSPPRLPLVLLSFDESTASEDEFDYAVVQVYKNEPGYKLGIAPHTDDEQASDSPIVGVSLYAVPDKLPASANFVGGSRWLHG